MPKYGRGLNREVVGAMNRGVIREPFGIADVRSFASSNGWDIPDSYVNTTLANAASSGHSHTYKKYFVRTIEGKYKIREEFRGERWT